MGAWILDSKAVSLGKITDTPKTDTRTKWEDVTYQLGGFLARHSAGEHVVKMALSILKHRLWVVEPAREHHLSSGYTLSDSWLSPLVTAPWMHWRLDRRVLTVNWSDAMEAGMLELHRGPIPASTASMTRKPTLCIRRVTEWPSLAAH